jgi:hypothetical protein
MEDNNQIMELHEISINNNDYFYQENQFNYISNNSIKFKLYRQY